MTLQQQADTIVERRCHCGLRLILHYNRDNRRMSCQQTADTYPTAAFIDRWVFDASGRAVAPPQTVISDRPIGPWDGNGQ